MFLYVFFHTNFSSKLFMCLVTEIIVETGAGYIEFSDLSGCIYYIVK